MAGWISVNFDFAQSTSGVSFKYPSCSSIKLLTIMPLPFVLGRMAGRSISPFVLRLY